LITPPKLDPASFAEQLAQALDAEMSPRCSFV